MLLKMLLFNDLVKFSSLTSQSVASEEAIRLMLEVYKQKDQLINPFLIHESKVPEFLKKVNARKRSAHYQLMVECGTRSLISQEKHKTIHYSAMDIFCHDTGKITVFIADHSAGKKYDSYRPSYQELDLPIHFIVAGGTSYQTDAIHCPIFTLQHLLLSAHDSNLHQQLFDIAASSDEKVTQLPWFSLPPEYNLNTQSFTLLTHYIDHQKSSEETPPDTESRALKDAKFDEHLSRVLESHDHKVKNRSINHLTLQFARDAFVALDQLTETEAIDICYAEKTNIKSMLKLALKIRKMHEAAEEQPLDDELNNSFFEFIFSNQPLFNLLKLENFSTGKINDYATLQALFLSPSFLYLVDIQRLNPKKIFNKITYSNGIERKLDLLNLNILMKNIKVLNTLVHLLQKEVPIRFSDEGFFDLLFIKHASDLLDIEPVMRLYLTDQINNSHLSSIEFDKLNLDLIRKMTDEQAMTYLREHLTSLDMHSPTSIARPYTPFLFGQVQEHEAVTPAEQTNKKNTRGPKNA